MGQGPLICPGTPAQVRDNNPKLVRLVAASAVPVSHAWPLTHGPGVLKPTAQVTGHSLRRLSVYAFAAISGCLVAASVVRSASVGRFVLARSLRLFPGLLVSLLPAVPSWHLAERPALALLQRLAGAGNAPSSHDGADTGRAIVGHGAALHVDGIGGKPGRDEGQRRPGPRRIVAVARSAAVETLVIHPVGSQR